MTPPYPANPIAAVSHPDPYPYYGALRDGADLQRDDALGLWLAVGAAAVDRMLREPAARVRPPAEPVPRFLLGRRAGGVFGALARMNDGPRHAAPRARVEALLPHIERGLGDAGLARIADPMALPWRQHGDLDALDDMVRHLPATVVAAALGVPAADRPAWVGATAAWVAGLSAHADAATRAGALDAMDDLLDRLAQLGVVDDDDAAAHVALLMQPHEATAGLLGAGMLRLARDAALGQAASNGTLDLEAFGAEVLRHDPPVQNTRRTLADDVALADGRMRAGDSVLIVLAAAERDPRRHAEPDRFRLDRAQPPALGLGAGPHRCPGGSFALRIAAAGWQALARGTPADRLAALGERVRWRPSPNVRIALFGSAIEAGGVSS